MLHAPSEVAVPGVFSVTQVCGGGGVAGDGGGGLGESNVAWLGQSPPCCAPGKPLGIHQTTPPSVCGCAVTLEDGGEGGGGEGDGFVVGAGALTPLVSVMLV